MARRKRTEPAIEEVADRDLEFIGRGYATFLMARDSVEGDPDSARVQLAEEAIHDEFKRTRSLPIKRQIDAVEDLLAELGLLEAARRHNTHRLRARTRWGG